ncbi:unnamed protein product, partial [Porites lobata]
MTRDTVLASRGNASRLTTKDLDLPSTAEINRIAIYSHLTPRLLELLHSAKAHQNTYNYKCLNRNLENLQTQLLHEVDFHFNVIGVTETKIINANLQMCTAHIPGYVFEYVPTSLASGGVGMFIDESLDYRILEKTSNEAFHVLWTEFSFVNKKN